MARKISNRYNLRIKHQDTIDNINEYLKLNNSDSINTILNEAIIIGINSMLNSSTPNIDNITSNIENNTRKVLRRINHLEKNIQKNDWKQLVFLSVQEAMLSFLINQNEYNLDKKQDYIPDSLVDEFYENLPSKAMEIKQELTKELFESEEENE